MLVSPGPFGIALPISLEVAEIADMALVVGGSTVSLAVGVD